MAEVHPVQERPDLSVERRLQILEQRVSQLWDCCWWLSLPWEQRVGYEAEGFTNPIEQFYVEVSDDLSPAEAANAVLE